MRAVALSLVAAAFARAGTPAAVAQEQPKPFSYYEVIGSRDLFKPVSVKPAVVKEPADVTPAVDPAEVQKYKGMKLRGIIEVDDESKAFIEDPGARESFYVGEGEKVKNATVRAITDEKIELEYMGSVIELVLERKSSEDIGPPGPGFPGGMPPGMPEGYMPPAERARRRTGRYTGRGITPGGAEGYQVPPMPPGFEMPPGGE